MLGLCCHYLILDKKDRHVNLLKQRKLQLGRWKLGKYSENDIKQSWIDNLDVLIQNLPLVFKEYQSFRFPSGILPLFDQVPTSWFEENDDIISRFNSIGQLIKDNHVRATFHPGQFCSLSSGNPFTIEAAIREINHHSWQFDVMGLSITSYNAINIHGGRKGYADVLIKAINGELPLNIQLTTSAKNRLTLENDETCYSVADLLKVFKETGVPVVFDSHHHTFNPDGLTMFDASNAAKATWGEIKPLQHISNSRPEIPPTASIQKRRAHSDLIYHVPQPQLDDIVNNRIDLDVEAKLKNLAIKKMVNDFKLNVV